MAIDVFVTYSPMDRLAATSLIRVLGTRGLSSWQPGVDLPVDETNPDRMEKLAGAKALTVLMSKATNQLKRIRIEIEDARSRNLPVIFVNLANAIVPADWADLISQSKLLQANRPPTDAQLDMIVDMLVLELGGQASPEVEFEAEIEPEGSGPEGPASPSAASAVTAAVDPNADLILDLAGDVDRAISERAGFGTGRLTTFESSKQSIMSQKTRAIAPGKADPLEETMLEVDLAEDDLNIDISDIKPSSQQSVATAPTQVIDAPDPKTLKQGINQAPEARTTIPKPPDGGTSAMAMPDMGDTLLVRIRKNALLIGAGTVVAAGLAIGCVFLIRMAWGEPAPNPAPIPVAANPNPTATAPSGTGAAPSNPTPGGSGAPDATASQAPAAPATPMNPAAVATVVLPKPSHVGWKEHDDPVNEPAPVAIDKSAANIFSSPVSGSGAASNSRPASGAGGDSQSSASGRGPQVAIGVHEDNGASPPDAGSVAPTAGSKGVLAARVFNDDAANRSRMLSLMIHKPGEKASLGPRERAVPKSETAASARARKDPENQAYLQSPAEFSRVIADQISLDAKSLQELKDQAEAERIDIQRLLDRMSAEAAENRTRIDAQILSAMQSAGAHPGNLDPWIARASLEREKGDLDSARKDVEHVLKINPQEPGGLKEQGQVLARLNDLRGAVKSMDAAVQFLPRDDEAVALLGQYWLRSGKDANADQFFRASLRINPNQALAHVGLGDLAFRRGEWAGALALYVTATELNPRSFEAQMGQGRALLKLRMPLKAISGFNEAIDVNASSAEPFARRAEAYCELFNFGRALANANAAVTVDPGSWLGHVARANVLSAMGRNESAIKHLYWAAGLNPASAVPVAARGRVYLNMGDWDQAAVEFASALNVDPNNLDAILGQSRLARVRGNDEDAMAWANRALQVDPGCAQAYVIRSHVLRETNDLAGASEQALEVLKAIPNEPGSLMSLGVTNLVGNSPAEADAYSQKAIETSPNLPQAYALRAIVSIEQGNLERARSYSDEMIKMAPGLSETQCVKGLADLAWCRYQSALDASNRALLINARSQGAMVLKARALIDLDQPRNAVKVATEALNWNENFVAGYVVRGRAYQAAGDRRHAQVDFQKARELDPQLDLDNVKLYGFDGF